MLIEKVPGQGIGPASVAVRPHERGQELQHILIIIDKENRKIPHPLASMARGNCGMVQRTD